MQWLLEISLDISRINEVILHHFKKQVTLFINYGDSDDIIDLDFSKAFTVTVLICKLDKGGQLSAFWVRFLRLHQWSKVERDIKWNTFKLNLDPLLSYLGEEEEEMLIKCVEDILDGVANITK